MKLDYGLGYAQMTGKSGLHSWQIKESFSFNTIQNGCGNCVTLHTVGADGTDFVLSLGRKYVELYTYCPDVFMACCWIMRRVSVSYH